IGDDELCAERKKCAFTCGNDELHNGDDEFCAAVHNGDDELLKVGLGLHPWYVQDADVERFEQLCGITRFIGEVGLDFSKRFSENEKEAQVAAFERVARAVSEAANSAKKPKIMSIHSCKTAGRTHEFLSKAGCLENCILIYHWFNDDFATLQKCIKDGCLFSECWRPKTAPKSRDKSLARRCFSRPTGPQERVRPFPQKTS
ncbi:MAG: TatD family hydrolase, partial [Phoenicibacter congonensis]|nr:TatD family hydrolase [Phoenicibacter congonensis]